MAKEMPDVREEVSALLAKIGQQGDPDAVMGIEATTRHDVSGHRGFVIRVHRICRDPATGKKILARGELTHVIEVPVLL